MGHAVIGVDDYDGHLNNLTNVMFNENPVMNALGDPAVRMAY
jgi:hypothetical protein